jgi:hypothetical protein
MTPESQVAFQRDLQEAERRIVDRLTEVLRDVQSEILQGLQACAREPSLNLETRRPSQ